MLDFREKISHGNAKFPVASYRITPDHPRYQMAFHWHPEHEILYVVRGKLSLMLGQNEYEARAGDMFFIQGGTFHSGVASEQCEYHCFVFDLERLIPREHKCNELIEQLNTLTVSIDEQLGKDPEGLYGTYCALADRLFSDKREGHEFTVTGLLLQFVGTLVEQERFVRRSQPTEHTLKMLSNIRNVLYKIENEYAQPLTLESLAATANLSPNYFCRFFKRMTSRSPIEYLIAYRVNVAEHLLRTTDRTMTDIALGCGFTDVSHFIKYFRREKGITPKQFRVSLNDRQTQ
ncbi:MAG: AraC family transcriptional regulator [Clostridia bacterium]|nr:AraC family transcriptional regulator [Clostridia bacterium]